MLLSVIIVNWNSRDDLRACLESLGHQTCRDFEVVVVDNGSADGSADMVASQFSHFTLLRESENLGFAEACNRGIRASAGDWVAMLNNDAVADEGWASALLHAMQLAPADCGMLQSLMLYQERTNTINSAGIELAFSGGGRDRLEGRSYDSKCHQQTEEIFCPTAGAAAYRRAMLNAIRLPTGYFDRSHFMYYEDMDLGWRARLAGWSALYVPSSIVHHRWHGSTRRRSRGWLLSLSYTNRIRTLLKNASVPFIILTIPRTLKEVSELVIFGQFKAFVSLFGVIAESLTMRQRVSTMTTVPRQSVEHAWRARPQ
jgi:GT2 family glycosyltransferase